MAIDVEAQAEGRIQAACCKVPVCHTPDTVRDGRDVLLHGLGVFLVPLVEQAGILGMEGSAKRQLLPCNLRVLPTSAAKKF